MVALIQEVQLLYRTIIMTILLLNDTILSSFCLFVYLFVWLRCIVMMDAIVRSFLPFFILSSFSSSLPMLCLFLFFDRLLLTQGQEKHTYVLIYIHIHPQTFFYAHSFQSLLFIFILLLLLLVPSRHQLRLLILTNHIVFQSCAFANYYHDTTPTLWVR